MPPEFVLLDLLRQLPGYTRETLEREPAQLVERWLIYLSEEAKINRNPPKSPGAR